MTVFESKLWIYACVYMLLVFDTCFASMDDIHIHIHNISDLKTRKMLHQQQQGSCSTTGNAIDDCWRCDKKWHKRRKRLAECAIGFGKYAKGGVDGRYYIVTDSSDDDPVNPKKGTLRYAVIRNEPLWIFFKGDMVITLSQELIMNSFKTIDGRGASIHIAKGAGITIQYISNVIIHGVHIYDIKQTGNAMVRSSPSHYGLRGLADGDAISIFGSRHIWIDHNSLSSCADGLVDVVMGSTGVTISNNLFTYQNEVMLLGHSDAYTKDRVMRVTIAYNRFGEGLTQRMPHCRHGYFHVMNNDYTSGWGIYAIGGAANPTIYSQGNRFYADPKKYPHTKEVTKRMCRDESEWKKWTWSSDGDLFLNGAYFITSGQANNKLLDYAKARKSSMVKAITSNAGALTCHRGYQCSKMLGH